MSEIILLKFHIQKWLDEHQSEELWHQIKILIVTTGSFDLNDWVLEVRDSKCRLLPRSIYE